MSDVDDIWHRLWSLSRHFVQESRHDRFGGCSESANHRPNTAATVVTVALQSCLRDSGWHSVSR